MRLVLHLGFRYKAETASGASEVKDHILDDATDELWAELRHSHIAGVQPQAVRVAQPQLQCGGSSHKASLLVAQLLPKAGHAPLWQVPASRPASANACAVLCFTATVAQTCTLRCPSASMSFRTKIKQHNTREVCLRRVIMHTPCSTLPVAKQALCRSPHHAHDFSRLQCILLLPRHCSIFPPKPLVQCVARLAYCKPPSLMFVLDGVCRRCCWQGHEHWQHQGTHPGSAAVQGGTWPSQRTHLH